MKYVYIVGYSYDYEGDYIEGVYSSLEEARKHKPKGGDSQWVVRYRLDDDTVNHGKRLDWSV